MPYATWRHSFPSLHPPLSIRFGRTKDAHHGPTGTGDSTEMTSYGGGTATRRHIPVAGTPSVDGSRSRTASYHHHGGTVDGTPAVRAPW